MKTITAVVSFSQSKKYPNDWKVRVAFKDGYRTIITHDEVNEGTRFGVEPSKAEMQNYAHGIVKPIADGFGVECIVEFA